MSGSARHDDWGEIPRMDNESLPARGTITRFPIDRELPERATPSALGAWPGMPPARTTSRRMNEAAARVGHTLGSVVSGALNWKHRAQHKWDDLQHQFESSQSESSVVVTDTGEGVQSKSRRNLRQMRSRAQFMSHTYPIHFVLGAAAGAFCLGLVLGWWKNDEE